MSKAARTYRFPYTTDCEGYPKVEREMTHEQYTLYKDSITQMRKGIMTSWYRSNEENYIGMHNKLCYTPIVCPTKQDDERFKALSYPAPGYPERTVASSGEFIVIAYMLLKQFWVDDISIENLRDIANYGGWHHPNGTYHHFLDVVCEAYQIETTRLSTLRQVMYWMDHSGAAVALLDNKMFPESVGNCLVFITGVSPKSNTIQYFFPGGTAESQHWMVSNITEFLEYTKVLWGFRSDFL